ncbi:unnamed protein product [Gadus morhua 'NCC']
MSRKYSGGRREKSPLQAARDTEAGEARGYWGGQIWPPPVRRGRSFLQGGRGAMGELQQSTEQRETQERNQSLPGQ